jgi:hypothetical protein
MSRYTKQIDDALYVWGYDRPLQEYFLQAHNLKEPLRDDDDGVLFSISSYNTLKPHPSTPRKMRYSNGEILELMEDLGDVVPEEHRYAIAMDIPF